MNIYMLVEGRRTEMAVYPAWIAHLLPFMKQVEHPFEAWEDNLYIVSGFGYPNILHHIENCVKDVNKYRRFDYLVICLDSDDREVRDRIIEIETILQEEHLWPKKARIQVFVQKKCIETWFLGSDLNLRGRMTQRLQYYMDHYNVFYDDPEEMDKPEDYRGSVGDFHCGYLCRLLEANGSYYAKRKPGVVLEGEYVDSLRRRTDSTPHLATLKNFFEFCDMLRQEHEEKVYIRDTLAEEQVLCTIAEQKET